MHAVIARDQPDTAVVDLTHQIPPHDVRSGSLTLWRAAPWLVPGVILAVVDPGVATSRRAVAVEVAGADAALVGPDNGLLLPAALRLGSITAAVALEDGGGTFAGRDVFAPAAARLAAGAHVHHLGRPLDPATLAGEAVPEPVPDGPGLRAEVLWIDRFGNAQLNAAPSASFTSFTTGGTSHPVRTVRAFADLEPGEVGLVIDSYGLLAIALREASASAHLGLSPGQPVFLTR